jgi:hypothetical protein
MSTPLRRDGHHPQPEAPLAHLEATMGRRPTCQEEIAGRARERTNAHGTTPPPLPARERVGYASRELERLARGLVDEASVLRAHGEDTAADRLDRTSQELLALAHAMTASGRA